MHSVKLLKSAEGLEFIEITFNGDNTPYSAYDKYFLRFADRDKTMDQQMLLNYFEQKKTSYINWENSNSLHEIIDIDEAILKDYIKRGNECGRIKFLYDNKNHVLNRLGLLFDSEHLNNAGNVLFSSLRPINVKFAHFATERRVTILDMDNFPEIFMNVLMLL